MKKGRYDFYFVYTRAANNIEHEVIKELRPPGLLMSYYYWRRKDLGEVIANLGYKPKIMLDCGAYSAYNNGKEIVFDDYVAYVRRNEQYIDTFVALDVIGDAAATYDNYTRMRAMGLRPIPVYHYTDDLEYLQRYVDAGETFIGLGDTAKRNKQEVAAWANYLWMLYPNLRFHMLGSASKTVYQKAFGVVSMDAATWIIAAFNGRPLHIPGREREHKKRRAIWQMNNMLEKFN